MGIEDPVQLGYRGIEALDIGDKVLYKIASCPEYCPAEVTKKPSPGNTAVQVKLERPYYHNSETIPANQNIFAGVLELYWDRKTRISGLTIDNLFVK